MPFNQQKNVFGAVALTKAQLEPNKCVKVTMQCDNLLDNKADAEKTIPYTIYEGKADATGNVFTTASYLSAGDKTDLTDSSTSSITTSSNNGGTSNSNTQKTYPNNDSPNTGDTMAVGIGVPAFFLGVAFLMVMLKKRNKDEE